LVVFQLIPCRASWQVGDSQAAQQNQKCDKVSLNLIKEKENCSHDKVHQPQDKSKPS